MSLVSLTMFVIGQSEFSVLPLERIYITIFGLLFSIVSFEMPCEILVLICIAVKQMLKTNSVF